MVVLLFCAVWCEWFCLFGVGLGFCGRLCLIGCCFGSWRVGWLIVLVFAFLFGLI